MPKCIHYVQSTGACSLNTFPCGRKEGRDVHCPAYAANEVTASTHGTVPEIRTFSAGATRDTDANKPNYIKALSPIVLQSYVEYLSKHRTLPDGSMRDWDNWKSGLPKEVCLESLGRHEMAVWLLMQGFKASDNHGPVTLKDSLCGVIFNAMCVLHEILVEETKEQKIGPTWTSPTSVQYCPDCEKKVAKAKNGEPVGLCEVCSRVASHVLKKEQK